MSVVFVLAGAVVMAVTLFLFYQLREPELRRDTFEFTAWFVLAQEAVLFGGLAFLAARAGVSRTAAPVRGSYITTIVLYNAVAVGTVLLFNTLILPLGIASANTYYTTCVAESGLAVAALLFMQIVGVADRFGHSEAQASRANLDDLVRACERVQSVAESNGVARELTASFRSLSNQIRFSEGLRRDAALVAEVDMRVAHVEQIVSRGMDDDSIAKAAVLVREVQAIAGRRG